jgi:hypothetical protein
VATSADIADILLDLMLGDGHDGSLDNEVEVGLTVAGVEPVGNGYARVTLDNDTATWPDAAAGLKTCAVLVEFPELSGTVGTIDGHFVCDKASGDIMATGDCGPLATSAGIIPTFAIGELRVGYTLTS